MTDYCELRILRDNNALSSYGGSGTRMLRIVERRLSGAVGRVDGHPHCPSRSSPGATTSRVLVIGPDRQGRLDSSATLSWSSCLVQALNCSHHMQ
jgi:hypothetical protein